MFISNSTLQMDLQWKAPFKFLSDGGWGGGGEGWLVSYMKI